MSLYELLTNIVVIIILAFYHFEVLID